jgi:uncharacterized protein (DUF488 family)
MDAVKYNVATIGYVATTVPSFLHALEEAGVKLVVDVRAVAMSRRPGFAKTKLRENLNSVGIDYVHLRGLGTPADGRAAARGGRHEEMQRIFAEHMKTDVALNDLDTLAQLVRADRLLCLLCFEANPEHCHRTLVARALADLVPVDILNLRAEPDVA